MTVMLSLSREVRVRMRSWETQEELPSLRARFRERGPSVAA